jgi:glycosyltransferase involved in cell wall biosynthesis
LVKRGPTKAAQRRFGPTNSTSVTCNNVGAFPYQCAVEPCGDGMAVLEQQATQEVMRPRPLRILHVNKSFRPTFTGVGIFIEKLAPALESVCQSARNDVLAVATLHPDRIPVVTSSIHNIYYLCRRPCRAWWLSIKLVAWLLLNGHRYDVIHVHTHVDRYFLFYVAARILKKRLILSATLDDSIPGLLSTYQPRYRWIAQNLLDVFHVHHSLSPKLHHETIAGGYGKKAVLLPFGIAVPDQPKANRLAIRQALGFDDNHIVLVFVGGLCARKDPEFLLKQMPDLIAKDPRVRLLLVGPPLEQSYCDAMSAFVVAHGLENHVSFRGESTDTYSYLAGADIMVFASTLEGFGAVVPEAMAHELPVVVRRLPGVNDTFVHEGQTGFFFETAERYQKLVLGLAADPVKASRIGRHARQYVIEHLDILKVARDYLHLCYGAPQDSVMPAASPGMQNE